MLHTCLEIVYRHGNCSTLAGPLEKNKRRTITAADREGENLVSQIPPASKFQGITRTMTRKWPLRLDHPTILLSLTALFWAGNAIAGKAAVGAVPPMALNFLRWLVAMLILLGISIPHIRRDWPVIRARAPFLLVMGGLGFGSFNLFLYNAVHTTSALNVAIEQSAMPMVILFIGFLVFRERIGAVQIAGIILSLLGVAVTVTRGDLAALLRLDVNHGDALMVGGVLAYSVYTAFLRLRPPLHWLSFLSVLSISATFTCLPFFLLEMANGIVFTPNITGVALILYVAVFPSILAQLFFARGVGRIGAGRAGMFINLVPLFSAILAIGLLGERLHLFHLAGFALIMAGVWLGARKAAPAALPDKASHMD